MGEYSEDDARRIFARAAERQGADDVPADGLSLAELQAIGEASGIDPAHVAAAAAELRSGADAPARGGFAGIPAHVRARRVLPGALSDEAWARVVEDLRATFHQTGVVTDLGTTREWTASQYASRDGIRVAARERPDGQTELTAEHRLVANVQALKVMTAIFSVLAAVLTVVGVLADKPGSWMFGPVVGFFLAFAIGIPVWMMARQARHAERAFGPLLDQAERVVRSAPDGEPAVPEPDAADRSGRLDLPAAEADLSPTRRRTRRRSR